MFGLLLLGILVVPALAFYSLGFAVRRGWLVGALWLAGTLPLTGYAVVAGFSFFDLAFCGAGCFVAVD